MAWLPEISSIISGLTPLGASATVIGIVLFFYMSRHKNRFEEDEKLAEFREKTFEETLADLTRERRDRRDDLAWSNKIMAALRWWNGFAHRERHDRMNDRTKYVMHASSKGIEPLMLPEPATIPRLVEDEENPPSIEKET